MKTKTLAAIAFAIISISLISCYSLFGKKSSVDKTKTIVGKWTIDSITDSSKGKKNEVNLLAFTMIAKDSTPLTAEFKPDSSFTLYQNNKPIRDSGKYYFDSTVQTLFLKENSAKDSSSVLVHPKQTIISSLTILAVCNYSFFASHKLNQNFYENIFFLCSLYCCNGFVLRTSK
jgi:hypothetical protein